MALKLRIATTSILLLLIAGANAAETPATTGESKGWELKGIHLGGSQADVQAQLPTASCVSKPADAGIVLCTDDKNTLGGEPASVVVKLLDGLVVHVSIENLTYEQAYAACAPLAGKFGPATEISKVPTQLQRGRYVERQNKERCVWRDGENSLYVEPADWTDKKKLFTYSAIILIDEPKHNREWTVRYNAKNSPTDL